MTQVDPGQIKGKILIVDDTPHNLRLLSMMLIEHGYTVRAVINGSMALKSIQMDVPNIILLDINMPDMNGYEVCRRLKTDSTTSDVPVIFISAMDEVDNKIEAFRVGGVDYITKPFQVEEVLARIEHQLTIQRTKEALRQSEQRFRTVADYTYNWEYWIGRNESYLYVSPACERITGYQVEEFMNDPDLLIRITHPDDVEKVQQHLHNNPHAAGVRMMDFRITTRTGEERWISHTCHPVYDTDGNWNGSRASNSDITEQKRAEEERRKLQRAVEQSPASIVITDTSGAIEYVNPKFCQVTGYTVEEARGQTPRILKTELSSPESYRELWETITAGKEWRGEFLNRKKNGDLFWEAASISPVFNEQGVITHFIAVKEDITEQKGMEEALRRSEERFRLLAENAQDIIFRYRFVEPHGFEYVSPAVQTIMGMPPESYYADPNMDLKMLHPDSWPQFQVIKETPEAYREPIIMRYVRSNGQDVWIEQNHRLILDDEGKPIAIEGIARDITERKRAEETLHRTFDDLKRLNEHLQNELSMAQHIQQGLLPPPFPDWNGPDVACYNMPAREVGGDLYAYHALESFADSVPMKRYILSIGDVSGKGMPAALLMAVCMVSFRSVVDEGLPVYEALMQLDHMLADYTYTTRQNCALVYAEIRMVLPAARSADSAWAERLQQMQHCTLHVSNAGCVYPIIKRADGSVRWIDVSGLPLGVGQGIKMGHQEVMLPLTTGDMVVLTSDGVVEAKNTAGDLFGFERLERAVRTGPQGSARMLLAHLRAELEKFVGPTEPHDDLTIVVAQV